MPCQVPARVASRALIFSEWLAALRAALDNALYALAAATSGQNPPPQAERTQYPICMTPEDFKKQAKRLSTLPEHVVEALKKSQPYQSPYGPKSNLSYWIHELPRKDRHRSLHVGLGRVDEHRVRVAPPPGVTIQFDQTVKPYSQIEGELVVGRFAASRQIQPKEIKADLSGVAIAPEIPHDRLVVPPSVEHPEDDDGVVAHDERDHGPAAEPDRPQPRTNVVSSLAAQRERGQVLTERDDRVDHVGGGHGRARDGHVVLELVKLGERLASEDHPALRRPHALRRAAR